MTETKSTCPLLRRRLRVIIGRTAARSAACAATPITRPTSAGVQQGQHAAPERQRRGDAPDAPAAADARAQRGEAAAGDRLGRSAGSRHRALRRHRAGARAGRGRLSPLGPVAHRGLLRLQQARQGPARHQQPRHQFAPVHELARCRATRPRWAPTRRRPATTTWRMRTRVFIAGSNTAFAHPILFRRIEDAARQPGAAPVVVDPRRTETAEAADLFLQIQPGSDVALFNGMLHLMLWEGLTDGRFIAEHTSGFERCATACARPRPGRRRRLRHRRGRSDPGGALVRRAGRRARHARPTPRCTARASTRAPTARPRTPR